MDSAAAGTSPRRSGTRLSRDHSSLLRKRALRRLSHEQPAAYSSLYEQVLAQTPGLTRHQARGRAWTRLRYQFPDRYLELAALEHSGIDAIPPGIRTKSWQRATARLADLCPGTYQPQFARFRADGMTPARASDRAAATVRGSNPDLFTRLLTEEYQLWLTRPQPPRRPPATSSPATASTQRFAGVLHGAAPARRRPA